MSERPLRLYTDPTSGAPATATATVKGRLRDLFPFLVHAHRHNYRWLKDLADDEIVITRDLAEILEKFKDIVQTKRGA